MRLWSLHPRYLDRAGLLALWREALLAQAVLAAKTGGYRRHPQLERFRDHPDPGGAIAAYLEGIRREGKRRGYRFNAALITGRPSQTRLPVTDGQLHYERNHLARKLARRDPPALARLQGEALGPHPFFRVVAGPVAAWEKTQGVKGE
ncbi:MAG: pyrimidine dimer DNA glycosylase/endonuclease V [Deltaproteobacteria bacterium]|nr:pyrimidine dimer DNA glycosylase/endonuclease V [Deltaproteobacteria bacterium]